VAEAVSRVVVIAGTLVATMNGMGWVAVLVDLFGAVGCGYFSTGQRAGYDLIEEARSRHRVEKIGDGFSTSGMIRSPSVL
jgi:hypothetical protein